MQRAAIIGKEAPSKIGSHYNFNVAGKKLKLDILVRQAKDKSGKQIIKDSLVETAHPFKKHSFYAGKRLDESAEDFTNRVIRIHNINTNCGLRDVTGMAKKQMRDQVIKDSKRRAENAANAEIRAAARRIKIYEKAELKRINKLKTAGKIAGGLALASGIGYGGYKLYQHNKNKERV